MENIAADNTYLIDLSYAKTPADVVFELSSVIENESAANKRVNLKLGKVDLNQSQLLSIKSLINGINSSLVTISSESSQTENAAKALGLVFDSNDEPEQYVPMTEHIKPAEILETVNLEENLEERVEEASIEEELNKPICVNEDKPEKEEIAYDVSAYDIEKNPEEQAEISENLDSIFDSEQKLEQLFETQTGSFEKKEDSGIPLDIKLTDYDIPEEEYTEEDYAIMEMDTKSYKQTVRSGQVINFDGNVVIIGDCHPGSEIIASGDITVWGVLGGIAHAGAKGNKKAKIRALNLNAIQLRIAQYYARRPDSINIMYAEKTNTFTPEEARILNDNIVILRLNDRLK